MPTVKLTKRVVEIAAPQAERYILFDTYVAGFGLRIYPSGQKTWILQYRPGEGGRRAPVRRLKIGTTADLSLEAARREAERLKSLVNLGGDPQRDIAIGREAPTVKEVAQAFLKDHVEAKRAESTKRYYEDILNRHILPAVGTMKAKDVTSTDVARLHRTLRTRPFMANRVVAVIGAMYSFAQGPARLVPKGLNPIEDVEKYEERKRERLLSTDELARLGAAIVEAETIGLRWTLREGSRRKHLPIDETRRVTKIDPAAAAALRLLLFTGARLREILHLRWDQVDLERGIAILPTHKTSRRTGSKTIVLSGPALDVLSSIDRIGIYVVASRSAGLATERPRADLKRPWSMVTARAGLEGVRIHDLRHNFASLGVGRGMGLPIVGKLLGHASAISTQRYSHLDNDPLRRAADMIGSAIETSMRSATKRGARARSSSRVEQHRTRVAD
jgi:integrase